MREQSRSREPSSPRRRAPGSPTSHVEDHFHDLPQAPQFVPNTPPASAFNERRSRESLSRAPTTPYHSWHQRESWSLIQLIEQLIAENAALHLEVSKPWRQPKLFPWLTLVELH
eukprot:2743081-Amphidinium_carterae.1